MVYTHLEKDSIMQSNPVPFNLFMLSLRPEQLATMRPTTSLNIYDSKHGMFHPDGLWSNETFGPPGNPMRDVRFSYIDIKIPIFHPRYFKALVDCKRFYREIMSGKEYAVFDPKLKDFVKSDIYNGDTGYNFFLQHFQDLKIEDTGTEGRRRNIALVEKFKDKALTQYILVIPAGKRDVVIKDGRPTIDDINDFYKRFLTLSNNITSSAIEHNPKMLDTLRYNMQVNFNGLYNYIEDIISGKKGMFQSKLASRKIHNTSRNVITASVPSGLTLNDRNNIRYMTSCIGLYQMMKDMLPFVVNEFKTGWLSQVFQDVFMPVDLVNPKTLRSEPVNLDTKYFDLWQTEDGINKLVNYYAIEDTRHKPVIIEGRYLALIYKAKEEGVNVFKIIRDINELPADRDKSLVTPITYSELYYALLRHKLDFQNTIVVRYPIAGVGSNIPTESVAMTTVNSEQYIRLNDDWSITDEDKKDESKIFPRFPIKDEKFHNSLAPPLASLTGAGADFDGDTMSCNTVHSDEAKEEIQNLRKKVSGMLGINGKILHSVNTITVEYIMHNLTSDVPGV